MVPVWSGVPDLPETLRRSAWTPRESAEKSIDDGHALGGIGTPAIRTGVLRVLLIDRGADGTYDRVTCYTKVAQDVQDAAAALAAGEEERRNLVATMNAFEEAVAALSPAGDEARYGVKYCRRCELNCPAGKRAEGEDAAAKEARRRSGARPAATRRR